MSTAAQLAANRANAQHSTGPVTEAGKAASSRNAVSHGLRSNHLSHSSPEEEQAFLEWCEGLKQTHNPVTALETELFRLMAIHGWKSRQGELLFNACYNLSIMNTINGHYEALGTLTPENKLELHVPGVTPAETLAAVREDPALAANLYMLGALPRSPRLSVITLQRMITTHENAFHRNRKELERLIAERRRQEREDAALRKLVAGSRAAAQTKPTVEQPSAPQQPVTPFTRAEPAVQAS
jgi:hypothetical protein